MATMLLLTLVGCFLQTAKPHNLIFLWLITYFAPGSSPLSALIKASLALFAIIADFPEPALPMSSSGALGVSLVTGPVM